MTGFKKVKKTYTTALPTSVWNAELKPRAAPFPIITKVWAKSRCHVVMFRQDKARCGRYHLLMPHLERHWAVPWDQGAGTAEAVISCVVSPPHPAIMKVFYSTLSGRRKKSCCLSSWVSQAEGTDPCEHQLLYHKHSHYKNNRPIISVLIYINFLLHPSCTKGKKGICCAILPHAFLWTV